jgi:hypothetical protein
MSPDLNSTRQRRLSRREVLKALAAMGGAAAVSSFLPEKWVKPVVEAGGVPAHAQSSNYIVQCHILDLAFRNDAGIAKDWVPAAGNFRLEVLGQVVPPVAGLSMRIEFAVLRPYLSSNIAFHFYITRDTDTDGFVRSDPLQVSILAEDGIVLNAMLMGNIGYCGLDYQVP